MKTTEYKEYCDNLTFELAGWKEKIDHIVAGSITFQQEKRKGL